MGPALRRALPQVIRVAGQSALPQPLRFVITRSGLSRPFLTVTQNPSTGFSFLVRNIIAQDDRFHSAFSLLESAIAARAFPACSLAVTLHGEFVAHKALGRFTYD